MDFEQEKSSLLTFRNDIILTDELGHGYEFWWNEDDTLEILLRLLYHRRDDLEFFMLRWYYSVEAFHQGRLNDTTREELRYWIAEYRKGWDAVTDAVVNRLVPLGFYPHQLKDYYYRTYR